jgi:hypothetical protein
VFCSVYLTVTLYLLKYLLILVVAFYVIRLLQIQLNRLSMSTFTFQKHKLYLYIAGLSSVMRTPCKHGDFYALNYFTNNIYKYQY